MHKKQNLQQSSGRGFTLIELLVVVAIIALLISILLPALQQAKDLAKEIVCKSDLKSIHTGMQLYSEENNGWIPKDVFYVDPSPPAPPAPGAPGAPPAGPTHRQWMNYQHALHSYSPNEKTEEEPTITMANSFGDEYWRAPRSYVEDVRMFSCPMDDHIQDGWTSDSIQVKGSYQRNGRVAYSKVGGDPEGPSGGDYYKLDVTIRSTELYLLGETWRLTAFRVSADDNTIKDFDPEVDDPTRPNYFATRHGTTREKGYIAFADGHVDYETIKTIGLYGGPGTTWDADLPWLNGINPPWFTGIPPTRSPRWP